MGRQPPSMKRYVLLFAFALFFFATTVIAQDRTTTNGDDDAPTTTARPTDADETGTTVQTTDTERPTATEEDTDTTTTADNNDEDATTTTDNTEDPTTTTEDSKTTTTDDATTTTAESTPSSTDDATTTSRETAPPLTTTTTGRASVPPLKTSAGAYSYPAPSVPPTDNAPFMKPSNVPEGTFFIAVGAVLGAMGAAILLWRAVVAWQLHRNVKRAALAQQVSNDKLSYATPAAPFYKFNDRESSPSLSAGRGVRRTQRGPIPSSTPSQTNLFFSPTAPGANSTSNRESRFLPSGFYAAGAAAQQQGHGPSISLTNLRPDSRGHARAVGPSPPDSPSSAPREPARRNLSTSTLNLTRPTSGRAPSAYLDDLLADQPEQFPPQQPPPPNRNSSWQSQNRH